MTTIRKTVRNEIRKWGSFDMDLFIINDQLSSCYNMIFLGDYNDKKIFYFITLSKNEKRLHLP